MRNSRRSLERHDARRSGFTLLEVLLVLAILGVIAAMVVPNLLGRQEEAYRKATRTNIAGLENAAKQYAAEHDGEFPATIQVLLNPEVDPQTEKQRAPYLERPPLDAWKNELKYEFPPSGNRQSVSGKPAIWSIGPDKQDGTADDITNWSQQ